MIEEKLAQDILVNINFWEADWKNSSREISSQEMSTSCIPTSRNAEFGNFYFTNNRTFPLLTWMRNLKTNSPQSLLRSRLFHYHESLSMLEGNIHLYRTEDSIWSATLTCFDFYNKCGMKKTIILLLHNAFVKSLASEERHDGNIVPDVLRERAERRAQSRNIYIYIFHNIRSRNS